MVAIAKKVSLKKSPTWERFGSRFYDPFTSSWMSRDPALQFASPYTYGGNGLNPVNGYDPDGHFKIRGRADFIAMDQLDCGSGQCPYLVHYNTNLRIVKTTPLDVILGAAEQRFSPIPKWVKSAAKLTNKSLDLGVIQGTEQKWTLTEAMFDFKLASGLDNGTYVVEIDKKQLTSKDLFRPEGFSVEEVESIYDQLYKI